MWNGSSNYKRFATCFVFFLLMILFSLTFLPSGYVFAADSDTTGEIDQTIDEHINDILYDIDSTEIDQFLFQIENENFVLFENLSFKDLVLKIINGTIDFEIDDVILYLKTNLFNSFKSYFLIIISLFVTVIIFEIFNIFCIDKYVEIKKIIEIIFSFQIALILAEILHKLYGSFGGAIDELFGFVGNLFPIILSLLLLSGATGTHAVTSALAAFVINTGSYIFKFVLFPLSLMIVLISIFSCLSTSDSLQNISKILKSVFKTIVAGLFAIFGIFSTIDFIVSGMKDGLGLRVTKYAIKNYVPILGGYISEGFDFVRSCSILVKNAFGVIGIFVLFYIVLKVIIINVVVYFSFKILSVLSGLIGKNKFSNLFDNFCSSISYFFAVFVGLFLVFFIFLFLVIVSVSVI